MPERKGGAGLRAMNRAKAMANGSNGRSRAADGEHGFCIGRRGDGRRDVGHERRALVEQSESGLNDQRDLSGRDRGDFVPRSLSFLLKWAWRDAKSQAWSGAELVGGRLVFGES